METEFHARNSIILQDLKSRRRLGFDFCLISFKIERPERAGCKIEMQGPAGNLVEWSLADFILASSCFCCMPPLRPAPCCFCCMCSDCDAIFGPRSVCKREREGRRTCPKANRQKDNQQQFSIITPRFEAIEKSGDLGTGLWRPETGERRLGDWEGGAHKVVCQRLGALF